MRKLFERSENVTLVLHHKIVTSTTEPVANFRNLKNIQYASECKEYLCNNEMESQSHSHAELNRLFFRSSRFHPSHNPTCGYFFRGSTLVSMARAKAAVFPVPDWLCAIRFCGLQTQNGLVSRQIDFKEVFSPIYQMHNAIYAQEEGERESSRPGQP